jgi:hypothetical protein
MVRVSSMSFMAVSKRSRETVPTGKVSRGDEGCAEAMGRHEFLN